MSLRYVTRQNSTPHGKPKVLYCCHPDDFEPFFSEISKDILDKQDCTIWFWGEAEEPPYATLMEELSQMQLFVFPITRKLLCTENSAMDIVFPYAQNHNIPVLPLLQEKGLEEIYTQRFGSLQYLNKYDLDRTALSYGEKLEKYLESVLIGSDLAEKIRAAFDAYIFLSYRKKDRKYALELMRLIHSNPLFQDIGIWFDEFLIPGENFNDVIKAALSKSDLFMLTVTPNLINEPNYIMDIEYPLARQEGKSILPAELVATDHNSLSEKYEDIPSCVNAYSDTDLSVALLESIKKLAICENDASPEHKFFIGLAYLGGIDVEVDFKKAFALISSAAESGLIEAMQKLSEMYHDGNGVPQDYTKAVYWRKKATAHFETAYQASPSLDTAYRYVNSLFILSKYEFNASKEDFLSTTVQIINLLNVITESYSDDTRNCLAVCHANLGYYYLHNIPLWRFDLAEEHYIEAAKIYKQLSEEQISYLPKLASTYKDLGRTYMWLNKFDQSQSMLNDAIAILRQLGSDGTHDFDLCKADVYFELATLYRRHKMYDQTEFSYKEGISILNQLKKTTGVDIDTSLVLFYEKLSDLYVDLGQMSNAEKYLLTALDLSEGMVAKMAHEYSNRPFNAILKKELTREANTISSILESLQNVYKNDSIEKLVLIAKRTTAFFAQMSKEIPDVYNFLYGSHTQKYASFLQTAQRYVEAEQAYQQAISIFEKCIPGTRSCHFNVAEVYNDLAVMHHDNEQFDKAAAAYRKALQIRQYCARELSGKYADTVLALSYMNLGILLYDTKQYDEAEQMYLQAVALYEKTEKHQSVAKLRVRLGDLYRAMRQPLEGVSQFHSAIAICEQNAPSDPENFVPILADAHDGLSFLYEKEGDLVRSSEEAAAAKKEALKYPMHPTSKRILRK